MAVIHKPTDIAQGASAQKPVARKSALAAEVKGIKLARENYTIASTCGDKEAISAVRKIPKKHMDLLTDLAIDADSGKAALAAAKKIPYQEEGAFVEIMNKSKHAAVREFAKDRVDGERVDPNTLASRSEQLKQTAMGTDLKSAIAALKALEHGDPVCVEIAIEAALQAVAEKAVEKVITTQELGKVIQETPYAEVKAFAQRKMNSMMGF